MTARTRLRSVLLTLAFVVGTAVFGWLAVPLIGLAWDVLTHERGVGGAWTAALAATLAWAALLLWTASQGPAAVLLLTLGRVLHAPPVMLVVLTLIFPAALAWSAAAVGESLRAVRGEG